MGDAVLGIIIVAGIIALVRRGIFRSRRASSQAREARTGHLAGMPPCYCALFEASPDPIFLIDPYAGRNAWILEDVNKAAEHLLGYERRELIGQEIGRLLMNPPTAEKRALFLDALHHNSSIGVESVLRCQDGSALPLELSSVFLNNQGRDLILMLGRDVRRRDQVQTLQDDYEQVMLMLNQVAIDITSTLHVDEIMSRLVEAAHQVFPQSLAVTVQLLDEPGEKLTTAYASDGTRQSPEPLVFERGEGVAGLAVAEQQVINIGDVEHDIRFVRGPLAPSFKSLLVAPLISSSRTWGTLSIEGVAAHVFTPRDERMANMLARQAGSALENAYLYEAAQRQREIADTLRDVGTVLTSALRQEDVLQRLIQQVERVLHYDAASIWMNRPDGSYYRFVGVGYDKYEFVDTPLAEWPPGMSTALNVVGQTRQVLIIPNVQQSPLWHDCDRDLWIKSWAGAPIIVRGELSGVFCLDHEQPNFYGPQHRSVLEAFAAQVSIAIENALLFEQVQNYALNLQQEVAQQTAEIRAQQERTDAILSNIEDAVITFNSKGTITYANEATQHLLGWKGPDLLEKPVLHFIHRNTSRAVRQAMIRSVQQQQPWRGEVFVQHRRGYPILLDLVVVPYHVTDDEVLGFISSMRVLTDERVIERMKVQFMTLVSHELRTPLTNLKLHLHLLRKTIADVEKGQRYLDVLDVQTHRLTTMMEKVLAVIRLTDNETLLYHTRINFESLLDSLRVRYRDQITAKHITLSLDAMPSGEMPVVFGDEHWVALACYELMENALAYTAAQGQISVSLAEFEQEGVRFLGLSVRDTGVGIGGHELHELHTAFTRVGDQRKGGTAGVGLGLFIAQSVGEQLGGGLKVESELGVGSCFTLYFPVKV